MLYLIIRPFALFSRKLVPLTTGNCHKQHLQASKTLLESIHRSRALAPSPLQARFAYQSLADGRKKGFICKTYRDDEGVPLIGDFVEGNCRQPVCRKRAIAHKILLVTAKQKSCHYRRHPESACGLILSQHLRHGSSLSSHMPHRGLGPRSICRASLSYRIITDSKEQVS